MRSISPYAFCRLAAVAIFASAAADAATLYHSGTVIPLADELPSVLRPGWFLVNDLGEIDGIGEGTPSPALQEMTEQSVDLSGRLVIPGFVSGHSHLWQSAFRGIAPDGELWPWINALHRTYGADFAPGDLAAVTAHGALDQLRHGVTTTYNHSHWLDFDADLYFEQFEAQAQLPQRFIFAHCLPLEESPEFWRKQIAERFPAKSDPIALEPYLGLSINLRPYGPPELAAAQVAFAEELGVTVQLHYLEQSARQEGDRANWPMYREVGIPAAKTSFAHFIHTTEEIRDEAAAAGASMIWNPLSNGRLGSGLPDIRGYLAAGLGVGMGVDGQASADLSDPFANMRMGLYALRMREENADGLQPLDILRLHTLATARVIGVDAYVGSLEPGKFADFLVLDPANPPTGPVWDPLPHLVFALSTENIEAVYIAGEKIVEQGKVLGHDTAALGREVETRIRALRDRHAARVAAQP
jgi:cytosine/adenosine deaminase-related metal-dependent hydrolase